MTERNFQVDIKSHDKVMGELKDLARQIDKGDYPTTPFERVYFNDAKTFFRHITPRRFDLLEELQRQESGLYSVPWDEVQTSFKLAA